MQRKHRFVQILRKQRGAGAALSIMMVTMLLAGNGLVAEQVLRYGGVPRAWVHGGFEDFAPGWFEDGGSNLYVNAKGIIETIHRWDVNNDGYVDLVLCNSEDIAERGPTRVFTASDGVGSTWEYQQMPNDSGWMSRIVDVDEDGFGDLVVANGENGVTSELDSYVYWGGPEGVGATRSELPTTGAYDVAVIDVNRDGRLDLVFPTAWQDHHRPGRPMLVRVYLQSEAREFEEATERYGLLGVAALSLAAEDLNRDGFLDMVIANYRTEHNLDTESFVYWGTPQGFNTEVPLRLPTHGAQQVILADLDRDGREDIISAGGDQVKIYWNRDGAFKPGDYMLIEATGRSGMFSVGAVQAAVADVDGDAINDLILATAAGVEIRSGPDLRQVQSFLAVEEASWVTAADLDADGRLDLIVSKYDDGVVYDTKSVILWNSASGFSTERVSWAPTKGAVGNTAGDLDGDGQPEVVFNSTLSGHIRGDVPTYIYLGNKEAEYGVANRLELPIGSGQSVIADLNMDGYPECIFTTEGLRIFYGGPEGPRPEHFVDLPATNNVNQDVQVADFNRDGYLDVFVIGQAYDTKPETLAKASRLFYGSRTGFSPAKEQNQVLRNDGGAGHLADVNRDGYLDVLFTDKRGLILIYLGAADGFSLDRTWTVPLPCPKGVHPGRINAADLNHDGWLDLIVTIMGHYVRRDETLAIFYGGPDGFSPENSQLLSAGYSPVDTAVADYNRDGNLDILVTAYSTPTARVIPAQLFWGNGKTIDLEHPLNLPTESSSAATQIDLNRDGWIDIALACHRNDIGHQVNSLIYWNSPEGFSTDQVTQLPGLGPHGMVTRDQGNAYTREPEESYISPPFDMAGQTASRIRWRAEVPPPSQLKFQLRGAASREKLEEAQWQGPAGESSYYERSGESIRGLPAGAQWLQYRAIFVSPYGCVSPRLRKVRIDLKPVAH